MAVGRDPPLQRSHEAPHFSNFEGLFHPVVVEESREARQGEVGISESSPREKRAQKRSVLERSTVVLERPDRAGDAGHPGAHVGLLHEKSGGRVVKQLLDQIGGRHEQQGRRERLQGGLLISGISVFPVIRSARRSVPEALEVVFGAAHFVRLDLQQNFYQVQVVGEERGVAHSLLEIVEMRFDAVQLFDFRLALRKHVQQGGEPEIDETADQLEGRDLVVRALELGHVDGGLLEHLAGDVVVAEADVEDAEQHGAGRGGEALPGR